MSLELFREEKPAKRNGRYHDPCNLLHTVLQLHVADFSNPIAGKFMNREALVPHKADLSG